MNRYGNQSIRNWAVEERPREKLISRGIASLTDSELIALLLASGNAHESAVSLSSRILESVQFNLHELGRLSREELMQFNGIGNAKALTLIAALELGRRRNQSEILERKKISGSSDAAGFLRSEIGDLAHEEFWVLFLNRQNKIAGKQKLSQGGMTGTVIDVRLVLKAALDRHATSLILCHNHPSGNLEPSDADKKITRQLKEAARLMDIPVLDHLIVTQAGHFSFADEGLL
ncbi:MAG: DNA repair protein RadC [Marinilabiliales bacterium]|nr:DNA repair protein RadC [Marinilabiliales bacterium]